MQEEHIMKELDDFLASWEATAEGNRAAFLALKEHLEGLGAVLNFVPRPGITYSLRASNPAQKKRELFVMADVIEDTPRWLSVCFYQDLVSDPDGRGDSVPGGLLGEDAICFDMEQADDGQLLYLKRRLDEAWMQAQKA